MNNIIFNEWKTYRQRVLPPTAGETQVRETKRAFYAGAHAMLEAGSRLMSDEPGMTQTDESVMRSIKEELAEFTAGVAAGRE